MTTRTGPSPLARLITGGVLILAGALLAFALLPNLVGAQTAQEDASPTTETTHEGRRGADGRIGAHQAVEITAELTGTSADDVHTALLEGASLATYAADNGVGRDELVSAIIAAAQAHLDERVADGSITQERAERARDGDGSEDGIAG